MSIEQRRQMIEPGHPRLSVVRQCELVSISRSGFYYQSAGEPPLNLTLMRLIDAQFLDWSTRKACPGGCRTPWMSSSALKRWKKPWHGMAAWTSPTLTKAANSGTDLRAGLTSWIAYHNTRLPHSTLAGRTPDEAYKATGTMKLAA
jgi:hypothetical protein